MCRKFMKNTVIGLVLITVSLKDVFVAEKITYISVEHPKITYYSRKYVSYANLTSVRYGRANPVYYVGVHFNTLYPLDNTVQILFDFYEFLTNQYKPSFIQMKWNCCDLIHKDKFFGAALKQGQLDAPCPYPPLDEPIREESFSSGGHGPEDEVFVGRSPTRWTDDLPTDSTSSRYLSGEYHLWNMTINPDAIPRGFPFTKGRIYCNLTRPDPTTSIRELAVAGYIDMEIRQLKVANRIKNKKL